ncbi:DUF5979 domain-containing protein [Homoserinibacter sp. GY 40078]|uniref:DUF5979 domain-containing protein n=1 Tax=Homoserinibacter sp. GY 40078 TaxID=2603275 RepID=UPI0011C9BF9D|nr:DUF5979 domain-containing protein [Homoserinibacter sp. GY 40078]TXK19134.1 isopeptide-forming domain-containing fimbrial protein [Homoserinibacter sp. GY 40078]
MVRARRRLQFGAAFAALSALLIGTAAVPAAAAENSAVLDITKSVDKATPARGQVFTYTITVDCSSDNCLNATVVDALPEPFASFEVNPTVVVTGAPATTTWGGEDGRTLTVAFTRALDGGGVGLASGDGPSIQVALTVPAGLSPNWSHNGVAVPNTATVRADNALEESASANVTVSVPFEVSTSTSIDWAPPSAQFKVGEASTITLTTRNTSNALADSLELVAPRDPTATGNAFDIVDLTGFGELVFPQGADRVQIDAYVDGAWVVGTPSSSAALPGGVSAGDVTGLRIRFTSTSGVAIAANGTEGSIELQVAQRATRRGTSDSLVLGASATMLTRGTVTVPDHGSASANGSDSYTISPLTVEVSGTVSFAASVIAAGTGTTATLSGRNDSNGPVSVLRLTQQADELLADTHLTFTRLVDQGTAWPEGATSAKITWLVDSGSAPAPTTIGPDDDWPAPSLTGGQRIVGFSVDFIGSIPAGESATVPFRFEVAPNIVTNPSDVVDLDNTIRVDAHNDAGDADPAYPSASLQVIYPQIDVTLKKTVTPSAPVPAGGRSVTQLRASVGSQSGFVNPTSIIITDVDGSGTDYWDAFDAVAIAPTSVPADSKLVIRTTTDGTTWTIFDTIITGDVGTTYAKALPAGLVGVRFEFTNEDGFAQGTAVQGNVAFVARSELRNSGLPVASGSGATSYTNAATVDSGGEVELPGGGTVTDSDGDTGSGPVIPDPGFGGLLAGKDWQLVDGSATVSSQSGQQRTARLGWGTQVTGSDTVVVADPADPTAAVTSTVFQAFDLVRIEAITREADPFIAFDRVKDIRLYNGSTWTSIRSAACATASDCEGRFNGYTLTAAERASTVGVEITFEEWEDGRLPENTDDPLTPPVGSGVTSGPDERPLDLTFQLRNRLRDSSASPENPWITASRVLNRAPDAGLVENNVLVVTGADQRSAADTIQILDRLPGVGLTKTSSSGSMAIPILGDVAAGNYPTTDFVLTARNTSDARAWYLRVTDQMPCSSSDVTECVHPTAGGVSGSTVNPYTGHTWDPETSPFDAFTITSLTMPSTSTLSAAGVTGAVITVWKPDGSTVDYTYNVTNGSGRPNTSQLADAVGISVLFSGVNADGGSIVTGANLSITLKTQLREFLRSDPTTRPAPGVITNDAFTQVWDGVLNDTGVNAYASRSADVTLANAAIDVTAAKAVSPTTILEKDRSTPVTVTLTATQGTSTASPDEIVISDTRSDFWNVFELRGLTSTQRPTGADRVRMSVKLEDDSWVDGAWGSNATLPSVDLADVRGVRFSYGRADGAIISTTAPAANWTAKAVFTVAIRDTAADGTSVAFPSTVTNTVDTSATNPSWGTDTASANRNLTLATGTFRVAISKTPAVTSSPAGETVNFTLVMRNTGTGYLNNPVVVDQLPVDATMPYGGSLLFDPTSEITYSTSSAGILPTSGQTVSYDDTARRITISWPAGSRLAPGEEYTVVIPLQLAPGLRTTDPAALNTFRFTSDRSLEACTLATSNGRSVTFTNGSTSCSTDALVTTYDASAITSFKGVKGDVGTGTVSTRGAVNAKDSATPCVSDSEGFYRYPCAANTVVGGTDLWKLQFTNGGNISASTATIVDVLPIPGDSYLRSGLARESDYRPVFAGDLQLRTAGESVGTTFTWQLTTTANPCPTFESNPTCSTASWVDGSAFDSDDYDRVTAVRIVFDFSGATEGVLKPGARVGVTYRTVNTPTTSATDQLAPVTASTSPVRAWNSFGVSARFTNNDMRRVEPIRAGVQIATGPIQVTKAIAGVAADFAPTSYSVTASCTVAGVSVPLPASGALTLAEGNAVPYTARIDGIPIGAECRIVEGETDAVSVDYSPEAPGGEAALLAVTTAAAVADAVPTAQRASVTNTFGTTSLTIVKDVDTLATEGEFGPFDFTLECASDTGSGIVEVELDAEDAAFTLADGQSKSVTDIPAPADCTLRETDADAADAITVTLGDAENTVVEGEAAPLELGSAASYTATVTNTYEAGTLSVRKVVTGGTSYGDAEFVFDVTCTYDGQTLLDTELTLEASETHDFDEIFPAGTSCEIVETDAGGASDPADDASVTIPGPEVGDTLGSVTAVMTNQFNTGSVKITKARTGDGAATYGAGPFTAQLACTWERDGETLEIPLPDDGLVVLDAAGGYTATVTGLIAGADCVVTEPESGAATQTTIDDVPAITDGGTAEVDIDNRFDVAGLQIVKERVGEGVSRWGDGPFEVEVECGYDRDGTWVDIDLGSDATQELSSSNGYEAHLDDLLVGAECTVAETDAGYAIESEVSTDDDPAVIPATGEATVTVTNTFLLGSLSIEKTASVGAVQGGTEFSYTLAVTNSGHVDAEGVHVADELDADLAFEGVDASGWTCEFNGDDPDGFGGVLACDYDTVLDAGDDATDILVTVTVRDTIAKDQLPNTAVVTSTTPQVDGDDDDVTTPVKWLDASATPTCLRDAPWLYYRIDARNVDLDGQSLTIEWKSAGGEIVHTDVVPITADMIDDDGVVNGRILWPGAAVDADGYGILWPGYRAAGPGETPDYENLVHDTSLPEEALRDGASVTLHINPETTVTAEYPPPSDACAETLGPRDAHLWFTKDADKTMLSPGDEFTYTMVGGNDGYGAATDVVLVDAVPSNLRVLSVAPAAAASAGDPTWSSCQVTDRDATGYGGVLRCALDRPLGVGQRTPAVVLSVRLAADAGVGQVRNVGELTGDEVETDPDRELPTLAVDDDATGMSMGLAATGVREAVVVGLVGLLALLLGVLALAVAALRRRRAEDDGA